MKDLTNTINIERITTTDQHYFFGYYDISPESPDGRKVLANRTKFINHIPNISESIEVGYFDEANGEYHVIGETYAWNFQEGCRLQWLDNKHVIYNDRTNDGFCSIVYDIDSNSVVNIYDMPIYSISHTYRVATTYGFVNNKYNYAHTEDEGREDRFGDGVYILDLINGSYRLVLPVSKLADVANSQKYHNWVEYCTTSPNGKNFFLIHRWEENGDLKGNQLCVCDYDGNVEILLNSKFISHTGWRGNDEVSSWCRLPGSINGIQRNKILEKTGAFKVARDIYHTFVKSPSVRQKLTNDAYILFKSDGSSKEKISNTDFVSDGHCSWSSDGRYMLTDTYPDAEHKRWLMIYDSIEDEVMLLGKYYAIPNGINDMSWEQSSMRCDLHPKWSFDEKHIYFDSVHEGFRGLYRINVSQILEE